MTADTNFKQGDSHWSLARKQLCRLNAFSGGPSAPFTASLQLGSGFSVIPITFNFKNVPVGWDLSTPNDTQSDLIDLGTWTGNFTVPFNSANNFWQVIVAKTFTEARTYYNNPGTVGNAHPVLIAFLVNVSSGYSLSFQPPADPSDANQLTWYGNGSFGPTNLYSGQVLDLAGAADMLRTSDSAPIHVNAPVLF